MCDRGMCLIVCVCVCMRDSVWMCVVCGCVGVCCVCLDVCINFCMEILTSHSHSNTYSHTHYRALRHPNIINFYGLYVSPSEDNATYIIMELMTLGSLDIVLKKYKAKITSKGVCVCVYYCCHYCVCVWVVCVYVCVCVCVCVCVYVRSMFVY